MASRFLHNLHHQFINKLASFSRIYLSAHPFLNTKGKVRKVMGYVKLKLSIHSAEEEVLQVFRGTSILQEKEDTFHVLASCEMSPQLDCTVDVSFFSRRTRLCFQQNKTKLILSGQIKLYTFIMKNVPYVHFVCDETQVWIQNQ